MTNSPFGNPFKRPPSSGAFRRAGNPAKLQVPNQDPPMYGSPEWNKTVSRPDLQVPNQDVPLGGTPGGVQCSPGFLPGSSVFRLHDGTLLDFKTGRMLGRPGGRGRPGEWAAPRTLTYGDPNYGTARSYGPAMEQMIANPELYIGKSAEEQAMASQLDPESARYWLTASREAKKLEAQMTDEQKAAMAEFEKHFPESRLIEESRKSK